MEILEQRSQLGLVAGEMLEIFVRLRDELFGPDLIHQLVVRLLDGRDGRVLGIECLDQNLDNGSGLVIQATEIDLEVAGFDDVFRLLHIILLLVGGRWVLLVVIGGRLLGLLLVLEERRLLVVVVVLVLVLRSREGSDALEKILGHRVADAIEKTKRCLEGALLLLGDVLRLLEHGVEFRLVFGFRLEDRFQDFLDVHLLPLLREKERLPLRARRNKADLFGQFVIRRCFESRDLLVLAHPISMNCTVGAAAVVVGVFTPKPPML